MTSIAAPLTVPVRQQFLTEVAGRRELGALTRWHSFVGAAVPYLPDVLAGFDEADGPERRDALLLDAAGQQAAMLRSLAHLTADGRTLELRFIASPAEGRVRLYLLAKASADDPQLATAMAGQLWAAIRAALPPIYSAVEPLAPAALAGVLAFPDPDLSSAAPLYIAEHRRTEALEDLGFGQLGYSVYPIQGGADSLHRVVGALARQAHPAMLCVCLRPTALAMAERDALGAIASACRELERETIELIGRQQQAVSLPAGRLADLYARYRDELDRPLLLRISVASAHPLDPGLCAELAADLARPFKAGDPQRELPNRQGTFVTPQDQGEYLIAWTNARFLELAAWGETLAQPPLERLRLLVDPDRATAAWRIPAPPLGGLPGMTSKPVSQFAALPPALLQPPPDAATVPVGAAQLRLDLLSKHLLVAGTTGSGKTNTCVQILHALWARHRVPFLVIEPVNAEFDDYRSLGHFFRIPDELRVFTVGDEGTAPLRFNPFAVPPGVIVGAHIAGLMSCFRAALPLEGVLPMLLQEAIERAYQRHGWGLHERAAADPGLITPTLGDLIEQLEPLAARYGGEVRQNIRGALLSRIQALINGSAGPALTARRSLPLAELFERPTILELRHLGGDEDRALVIGFILLALQEYCDRNRSVGTGRLNHVVLLEEAHTLLAEPKHNDPASGNARAGAVEFFTRMLAENRKYGQGFIIAEQIPTMLAEGAIKNTVTKVMHRLPARADIEAMGGTMNFRERHSARAAALEPLAGEAFFFSEGMGEAAMIKVPYFPKDQPLPDVAVAAAMAAYRASWPEVYTAALPFADCAACPAQCLHRARVRRLAFVPELHRRVADGIKKANATDGEDVLRRAVGPIGAEVRALGYGGAEAAEAAYCAFLHVREQVPQLESLPSTVVQHWLSRQPSQESSQ